MKQPVLDTTLRDMMLTVQSTIHSEIANMMQHFHSDISYMGNRVTNIETKMGEITSSFNDMVDTQGEEIEDTDWMKAKIADLEDRSRRNNVKIRGIPESIQQFDLRDYFTHLLLTFIPDAPPGEVIIDRIHRLPKLSHLPETTPRDTIAHINFFHIKEKFTKAVRNTVEYPQQYSSFSFFDDLSKYTMQH